ncbi:uncharacterized protein LOC124298134 isoform X1 [Neodiprion virginianus]|uniref:uncharacterized protein LOC124298134 isoform X1 n=1 Tax=Neodiprion virginianus TaxID=2961670 RepID=UPI001EE6BCA1|nr:uncharacterized protein LOC124298134 isoform X1 [Neodiprion virginianus]
MEHARRPPELSSVGAMDENWKDWKRQFLIFLKASGNADKPADMRASMLLNFIGPVGLTVLKNFTFDDPDDEENVEILIEKFENHFSPRKTEVHDRYIFFSSVRQHSETIPHYVQTLKKKASTCNFGGLTESLIRDKIILDVKNKELRKFLFEEKDLSLSRAVEMWEVCQQTESISKLCMPKELQQKPSHNAADNYLNNKTSNCANCNTCHEPMQCPAWGQRCENCGMLNHFTAVCNKPPVKKTRPKHFNPLPLTQAPGSTKKN